MRERAGIIGAVLRIESQPSDGTRVIVDVPMEGAR
jgi:signal transduction histidine kinase